MFLSLAHTEADIDQALAATDEAFAVVAARHGRDSRYTGSNRR